MLIFICTRCKEQRQEEDPMTSSGAAVCDDCVKGADWAGFPPLIRYSSYRLAQRITIYEDTGRIDLPIGTEGFMRIMHDDGSYTDYPCTVMASDGAEFKVQFKVEP